jgi:hypothetical protein
MLQRANELMASGRYDEAAAAFEQLARAAEARHGPRAPWLHVMAGRARLDAGQPERALPHLRHGLGLIVGRGQTPRAAQIGVRMVDDLRQSGHAQAAAQLEQFLRELLPDQSSLEAAGRPMARPRLPTHCPACGAALRPDDVEWLDEGTAECAYCGSPVHAQG